MISLNINWQFLTIENTLLTLILILSKNNLVRRTFSKNCEIPKIQRKIKMWEILDSKVYEGFTTSVCVTQCSHFWSGG